MVNIFTHTCPNHSGVGAIDSPDHFEQVFDPYYIRVVHGKNFSHDILMVRPEILAFLEVFKAFKAISFTITLTEGNLR